MEKALISRLSSLGDVACTLPVANLLKQAFPNVHITWAVDPRFAGVVNCCESVDEVVLVKPAFDPKTWPNWNEPFDVALDMQGLLKSAIVIARAKSCYKLGFQWQREGSALFSQKVIPDPSSIHIVDQYLDVARGAISLYQVPIPDSSSFDLVPKEADLEKISNLLKDEGIEDDFVVLNPGAAWASKRWPVEHFVRLIQSLSEHSISSVLIGSSPAEIESNGSLIEACGVSADVRVVNLAGKTSISGLIALLSLAKAHVGGDTGSTHLMAALGKPAIGLYSITKPQRSCPYLQFNRTLFDPYGIQLIQPTQVMGKILESL